MSPTDLPPPKRPDREPDQAPQSDEGRGRKPASRPYPVDDPGFTDPAKTPGAEPDYLPGVPVTPGTSM